MKLKRAGIFTKIVIIALIVYATVELVSIAGSVSEAKKVKDELSREMREAVMTNAELQYEIDHSGDPDTIEAIAREKLGLVMPGERIFYDVSN